jgi:hypothetical protein
MTQFLVQGLTPGQQAYGEAVLPSFGRGYAAHWLGNKFTGTPSVNLFGGVASTVVGTQEDVGMYAGAIVTASIATTTMTITAVASGRPRVGMTISGTGVTGGTTITSISGLAADGTGTCTVSISQTVASTTVTATGFYLQMPDFTRTIFTAYNKVTMIAVGKGVTLTPWLSDDSASVGNLGLFVSSGESQFFGVDSNAVSVNVNSASAAIYGTSTNDRWTMYGAEVDATSAFAFIQRTGLARATGATSTRASGLLGSTTKLLRFGRGYFSANGTGLCAFVGVWQDTLTTDQLNRVWAFLSRNMADVGETL